MRSDKDFQILLGINLVMNSAEKASNDVWETHLLASTINSIAKPFLKMTLIIEVAQILSRTHWQDTEHVHTVSGIRLA